MPVLVRIRFTHFQVWTHAIVGFAGLRYPLGLEPPPFYKGLTLIGMQLNFCEGIPIPEDKLVSLLAEPSVVDQDIAVYILDWWKDFDPMALSNTLRSYEDTLITGWEQQRKVYPKPQTLCALRTSSVAAHIDTLTMKDLRSASLAIARFDEMLRKEMVSTLSSMRRVWTEIQRFDVLVQSIENPNLSPPLLHLDAPPTETFNVRT